MKLICYPTSGAPPQMRPAPATREWMDGTPESFAYRCLPLNIANAHGWEVLSPCAFSAVWTGGVGRDAVQVFTPAAEHLRPLSHFGSGILTFHVNALFRTEPGINLFVTGPANRMKDGIAPLSAVVETDWAPYTFTMNWRFTRPDSFVHFDEGEPFCFFFPLGRDLVEQVEPEIRDLDSDAELAAEYRGWVEGRNTFNAELHVPASSAREEKWQKTYYRGRKPSGAPGHAGHRTKLRLRDFRRPEEGR